MDRAHPTYDMAQLPARACRGFRCPATADQSGFCDACRKQRNSDIDERRGSSSERGYDSRWRKARATYLLRHPLCVICKAAGRLTAATVVDHIIPHRGDQQLFWDTAGNWQALCKTCHDAKTMRESVQTLR